MKVETVCGLVHVGRHLPAGGKHKTLDLNSKIERMHL